MSILATIDWLADKKDSPWLQKILKINPHYGEVYDTAGHFFIINRRYEEGIAQVSPGAWSSTRNCKKPAPRSA